MPASVSSATLTDRLGGRRRAALVVVGALVLALGVSALIGKAASYTRLVHDLRDASRWWFPVCLAGEIVAYLGYILSYRETARVDRGPELDLWLTTRIVAAGFGAFVVATSAGGLAVDYWALRRAGARRHEAIARVVGLSTLQWAVLSAAACLSALALLLGAGSGAPFPLELVWLTVVPACFLAAAWVSAPRRAARLRGAGSGGRIRRLFGDAVGGVVIVRHVVTRPVAHLAAPGGTLLYWGGDVLCLWAGLRAFGAHPGLAALVLGYATGYAVTVLPLPAGGAGGVDASMTYALHLVGVPLAPALLGVFTYRAFNFWLPILPALAVLPGVRRLQDELPETERATEAPA